ncbi:hypothetical protein FJY63_10650, partial [Candidatus Sumerlaeota bacterium]|nr:hypothetical protein [Candidatus Sumerlaeota bacterium]
EATTIGDAAQPCAIAISDNIVALAWVSRLPTGSAISLGSLTGISRVGPSLVLPAAIESSFSRPRLAWGGGRLVHCVWFSDAARGGSGNLHYAALRF